MGRFLLGRLGVAVLLLLGVSFVTFSLTTIVPGDPALAALGEFALDNPQAVQAFRDRYRLDDPLPVRYGAYVANLVQGDMGESQRTRRPVSADLARHIPATLELAFIAIVFAIVIGVLLGTAAALTRDGLVDQIVRVLSLTGVSMPVFWIGLVAFYWLSFRAGIFPSVGRLDAVLTPPPTVTGAYTIDAALAGEWAVARNALHHTILPALVLSSNAVGMLTRFTRSAVLDVLSQDFVPMARAKGLRERTVVFRHVVRAAMVPVITLVGVLFGSILSGTVLVEAIFSWPGLGSYAFNSATTLDLPAITGVALFVAVGYIVINTVVDIVYGIIDPRIRLT